MITHRLRLLYPALLARPGFTLAARRLTTQTTAFNTVTDAIKADHRELERYYDNIVAAEPEDVDTKVRWQNMLVWELARHSVGEELVLYPAFEDYLTRAIADKDRSAHLDLKHKLKTLQSLYPSSKEFTPTLDSLIASLRYHIAEEETHDLPALEDKLAIREGLSRSLARSFERTKWLVPTRAHPSAPDRPPWETVVAFLNAPIDRVRDVFLRFPAGDTPAAEKGVKGEGQGVEDFGRG
ncbi:hypothetical protein FN846DRAFT_892068 [Sphaerosporella brunnea]|uniref:Hemerythrin-like domain-containing protein n=1 Tax=Sphaerosporella brunnea TaxID=1250544 RepID=A0A5J5ESD0_9PEZI|nr:hypothetical protein FN846DRAFT_892068 [Sphaerosporella brunnea]